MEEIMLLDGAAIEYVPRMGYMHIICELPFLAEKDYCMLKTWILKWKIIWYLVLSY